MNGNTLAKVPAMAAEFKEYLSQFDDMFVGREQSLKLIRYALLTQQHILLFGPPGTSKTKVCDAVFDGISGASKFVTELTAFMTEDGVFGAYDVKAMRDQGVLMHRTEHMLPEAKLARLGEFLDANPQTLRSMLSAMNERRMMRGAQQMKFPLMTVYCDTNKDPAEYIRRNPDAFAVMDRILYIDRLDYLSASDDVGTMVSRFQGGNINREVKPIDIGIIEKLSSFILLPPGLITDPTIVNTYAAAVSEYREERRKMSPEEKQRFILPDISDRRICYASQVLEAEAILNGRVEAKVDDIFAAGIVLCHSDPERALWKKIAEKHVTVHKQNAEAQTKNAQGVAIKALLDQLERDVFQAPASKPIADVGHTLQVLSKQLASIAPADQTLQKMHDEAKARFREALGFMQERAIAQSGISKSLPL